MKKQFLFLVMMLMPMAVMAGDTNGDGGVSITDAVSVVNIILNNGGTSAPVMDTPEVKEPE